MLNINEFYRLYVKTGLKTIGTFDEFCDTELLRLTALNQWNRSSNGKWVYWID